MRKETLGDKIGAASRRNPTEEEKTLGALLRAPYEMLVAHVYGTVTADFPGIRPAHGAVLRHILPDGSRATDLAELAGMTKQSMAYLLDSLQELGYIAFSPDPDDGRAKRAKLTERGVAVQRRLIEASRRAEARATMALGADGMATLRDLLDRLAETLRAETQTENTDFGL